MHHFQFCTKYSCAAYTELITVLFRDIFSKFIYICVLLVFSLY